MKCSINVDCTEKCPYCHEPIVNLLICQHKETVRRETYNSEVKIICVGLGNPGCPFQKESIKPLITCQECRKWKDTCMKIVFDRETNDYVFTDPDDFCKDGEAK